MPKDSCEYYKTEYTRDQISRIKGLQFFKFTDILNAYSAETEANKRDEVEDMILLTHAAAHSHDECAYPSTVYIVNKIPRFWPFHHHIDGLKGVNPKEAAVLYGTS